MFQIFLTTRHFQLDNMGNLERSVYGFFFHFKALYWHFSVFFFFFSQHPVISLAPATFLPKELRLLKLLCIVLTLLTLHEELVNTAAG